MALAVLSDTELVARCRSGDHDAWCEFVDRFSRYVFAIAVSAFRLGNEDAEDVFQDVFARAYEQLESLRDPNAVRPWLAQLTRRLCIDSLRRSARTGAETVEEIEPAVVDERLAQLEEALTVREALATLREECQEVLDRFFARDESYRTIAAALGVPAGTVASRIARCLTSLRNRLMEERGPVARLEVDDRG